MIHLSNPELNEGPIRDALNDPIVADALGARLVLPEKELLDAHREATVRLAHDIGRPLVIAEIDQTGFILFDAKGEMLRKPVVFSTKTEFSPRIAATQFFLLNDILGTNKPTTLFNAFVAVGAVRPDSAALNNTATFMRNLGLGEGAIFAPLKDVTPIEYAFRPYVAFRTSETDPPRTVSVKLGDVAYKTGLPIDRTDAVDAMPMHTQKPRMPKPTGLNADKIHADAIARREAEILLESVVPTMTRSNTTGKPRTTEFDSLPEEFGKNHIFVLNTLASGPKDSDVLVRLFRRSGTTHIRLADGQETAVTRESVEKLIDEVTRLGGEDLGFTISTDGSRYEIKRP